jgi:lipooligosaccharide transport system permease protein
MATAVVSPGAWSWFLNRLVAYRHFWRTTLISSVLEPVLFLLAMGLTLGVLVDRGTGLPGGVGYLAFLAPGLLAAAAMQNGAGESTYAVMGAIKWDRTYEAALATPVTVGDLVTGHLLYVSFRVASSAAVFLAVLVLFGAAESPLVLLALPAALLTGLAFAAPVTAVAARLENDSGFAAIQRFLIVPMFLFSGTFFPLSQYPTWFAWVVRCTPLYQGVALIRSLTFGALDWSTPIHVLYLGLVGVIARAHASRRIAELLTR